MFTSRNKTESGLRLERLLASAGEYHRGCLGQGDEFYILLMWTDQLQAWRKTVGGEIFGDTH